MRQPHIMRPITGTAGHPASIIAFDVETRPATCDPGYGEKPCPACRRVDALAPEPDDEVAALTLGRAVHAPSGGTLDFTTASAFWTWVDCHTSPDEPLWVVNHNIAFDLMVLRFDHFLTDLGWEPVKVIMPEPSGPFMIRYKRDGAVLILANLANWWGMRPLRSIGAVVGMSKGDCDPTLPRYRHGLCLDELGSYCARDALVVLRALQMWIKFCVDHDLGTFAPTQAGQALNAYRHRFMGHPIFQHARTKVLSLEREAYLGARTEAFRIGSFRGSFHVVDVNSLYPYVMREYQYPARLRGFLKKVTVDELQEIMADSLVVARCDFDVSGEMGRVVPHRWDDRLVYPVGRFTSTLTTPEIDLAVRRGVLTAVRDVAVYEPSPLFTSYVDTFYSLRMSYRASDNLVWYEIVKVFLNSLYGKFGQYNYEWVDSDVSLPTGVHVINSNVSRETYRSLGGVTMRRSDTRSEGVTSNPAIAAHVTAYARRHITLLRETAGVGHVWYMDTDSLFVDDEGLARLELSDDLGGLKLECSAGALVVRGLKDYEIGPKRRVKGIRANARVSGGAATQVQFRGIAGAMRAGEPGVARIGVTTRKLSRKYSKGTIEDSYVKPIHL